VVGITRAIHKINLDNLSERLPLPKAGDEFAQLALTFNTMLARLADAVERIRYFTADASHELRTPLAILRGETEVTLRWAKDPEELRRTLTSNLEEIDRMGRIIDDLLSLAKSEAGELHLNLTEFSLSDMLQDIYLMGSSLGQPKEIKVALDLQVEREIFIRGDQLQLHRMLLNLISNAVKYTPAGGSATLQLSISGTEAVIAVSDSGIGIPAQHLPHIFQRFYRVDESRNRAIGGTGLGLAIVKSIAESHGGRIEVASTPGVGSTFTVHIPLAGPPPRGKKNSHADR
jgi:heavy metal sensor kinase